ncbi:hypothetical protein DSO57_1013913 [Entomophthora muscae]|uniref:Uncharacterized protein n=2 Tax=Entomophthora muscae TaxID=34485 RepID=A0ACC2UBS0_9FUNG|nr:hypothetical protein DSO57_1025621 [Entomophthora muscae]KAJ9085454.1 hypothetical protein DSO57_1013913 [Entomophthora muscae]
MKLLILATCASAYLYDPRPTLKYRGSRALFKNSHMYTFREGLVEVTCTRVTNGPRCENNGTVFAKMEGEILVYTTEKNFCSFSLLAPKVYKNLFGDELHYDTKLKWCFDFSTQFL